jgi:hypothetical protein
MSLKDWNLCVESVMAAFGVSRKRAEYIVGKRY